VRTVENVTLFPANRSANIKNTTKNENKLASYKKQKEVSDKRNNTQTIYIMPKFTMSSREL